MTSGHTPRIGRRAVLTASALASGALLAGDRAVVGTQVPIGMVDAQPVDLSTPRVSRSARPTPTRLPAPPRGTPTPKRTPSETPSQTPSRTPRERPSKTPSPAPPPEIRLSISSPVTAQVGENVRLRGTVVGAPRADVFSQVLVGKAWTTQAKAKANAKGGFTLPASYRPKSAGSVTYRVGATVRGSTVHSKPVTVTRLADAKLTTKLDAIMAPFVATYGTKVGATITDVTTGKSWNRNGQVAHQMASTIKPMACAVIFAKAKAEGRAITEADYAAMTKAIVNSDNAAMEAMWNDIGHAAGFNSWISKMGISGVRNNNSSWGITMASASGVNQFMRLLVAGGNSVLPSDGARWIRDTMRRSTTRWGVGIIGSSGGRTISMKDGWSPYTALNHRWAINSFGWVHDSKHSFTIAITTVGWPTMNAGVSVINDIARGLESAMLAGHIG